jgi:hypothetical protein
MHPTGQSDLLHHDASNSIMSPMTATTNSPTQLTTTPASKNDSTTVTAHSDGHPISNKNEIVHDTTSNAFNNYSTVDLDDNLQTSFQKNKSPYLNHVQGGPSKPNVSNMSESDVMAAMNKFKVQQKNDQIYWLTPTGLKPWK